jgi:hypothetical protein
MEKSYQVNKKNQIILPPKKDWIIKTDSSFTLHGNSLYYGLV